MDVFNLTEHAAQSKLLSGMRNTSLYNIIQTKPVVFNNHQHYIPIDAFSEKTKDDGPWKGRPGPLYGKFNLLATTSDFEGLIYSALTEHVTHPYFLIQSHPEKIQFDWPPKYNITRDRDAVEYSQYMANTFLDYVRKNKNRFSDSKRFYYLSIENFSTLYTLISQDYALQSCYFFNKIDFPKPDQIRNIDF